MKYVQSVSPNLNQQTGAGWCLKFAQDSFGAPRMHSSATDAANYTKMRNSSRTMPNVAVPVWFDHWGTYQGRYANWGHVVVWVPGRGFLSSPAAGHGQLWLSSIEAVEKTFNAKFRFWSLDINTLQVAKTAPVSPTPSPGQEEDEEMATRPIGRYIGGNEKTPAVERVCVIYYPDSGYYEHWSGTDQGYINEQAQVHGTKPFTRVTAKYWEQAILPTLEKLLK